jgi:hypothetical protein
VAPPVAGKAPVTLLAAVRAARARVVTLATAGRRRAGVPGLGGHEDRLGRAGKVVIRPGAGVRPQMSVQGVCGGTGILPVTGMAAEGSPAVVRAERGRAGTLNAGQAGARNAGTGKLGARPKVDARRA